MADIVGFGVNDANRVAAMVKRLERLILRFQDMRLSDQGANPQIVKITAEPGEDDPTNVYPAAVQERDDGATTYSTLLDGDGDSSVVKLFKVDGGTLVNGNSYLAIECGDINIPVAGTDHYFPLFVTAGAPSSGSTEVLRLTSFFISDSAEQTTCEISPGVFGPSPLCFYPAQPQKLTCAGFVDDPDKAAVWLVFFYGWTPVPSIGGGAPATIVKVDGNTAKTGIDAGFSYTPVNEDHALTGQTRRVYMTTEAAYAYAIGCDPDTGEPVLTIG
jgi:hypothetical protein